MIRKNRIYIIGILSFVIIVIYLLVIFFMKPEIYFTEIDQITDKSGLNFIEELDIIYSNKKNSKLMENTYIEVHCKVSDSEMNNLLIQMLKMEYDTINVNSKLTLPSSLFHFKIPDVGFHKIVYYSSNHSHYFVVSILDIENKRYYFVDYNN